MVLHSLNELGIAFGLKQKKRRDGSKPVYCRECGGIMKHVPGTNVFLCENEKEDGSVCGRRFLAKYAF